MTPTASVEEAHRSVIVVDETLENVMDPGVVGAVVSVATVVVVEVVAFRTEILFAASYAETVYVYVVDATRPKSLNDAKVLVPTCVPSR